MDHYNAIEKAAHMTINDIQPEILFGVIVVGAIIVMLVVLSIHTWNDVTLRKT